MWLDSCAGQLTASLSLFNSLSGQLTASLSLFNSCPGQLTASLSLFNSLSGQLTASLSLFNSSAGQLTASLSLFNALVSFSYERAEAPLIYYQFSFSNNFLLFREAILLKSCSFKIHVFRDVTPCRWPNGSRRFERQQWVYIQGS